MENDRPAQAGYSSSMRLLSPAYTFAKGRASLFRAANGVNRALREAGCYKWKPLRLARTSARVLLEKMVSRDHEWFLTEIRSRPMWIPRRAVSQYCGKDYEPLTTELFCSSIQAGGVVLDIGANVGFFALLAAQRVGPSGKVFAFEPSPSNLEILQRNVALNGLGNVSCLGGAVTDRVGKGTFIIAEANDSNSFFSHPLSPAKSTVEVDCITVDSFLAGRPADVVKIDVEGAEISVLQGMQRTLEKNRDIRLFIELNPGCLKAAGRSAGELVKALKDAGLSVKLIDEKNHQLRELDEHLSGVPMDDPTYYANLFCSRT